MLSPANSVTDVNSGNLVADNAVEFERRRKNMQFFMNCILIMGAVGLLLAFYTQAQFLIHQTPMGFNQNLFLYGTIAGAGLCFFGHIAVQAYVEGKFCKNSKTA